MSHIGIEPSRWTITGNFRAQFALGISLGLMIGIVPKDSLLPWVIALFTLLLPVNLGATLVAVVVGCLVSVSIDGFAHRVGEIVLGNSTVLSFMTDLNELPLFAWNRLNNTVVMGLTTIGILVSIPAYLTAHAMYRDPRIWSDLDHDPNYETSDDYPVVHTPNLQES